LFFISLKFENCLSAMVLKLSIVLSTVRKSQSSGGGSLPLRCLIKLPITGGGLAQGGDSQKFARERTLESPTGLSAGARPALRQTAC